SGHAGSGLAQHHRRWQACRPARSQQRRTCPSVLQPTARSGNGGCELIMNDSKRYVRLGVFVFASFCVLAAVLFLLGGRKLFQPTFTFETYFDKSVAGLDIGAPVSFRGVPLGQVSEILTSTAIYEKDVPLDKRRNYIVVRAK